MFELENPRPAYLQNLNEPQNFQPNLQNLWGVDLGDLKDKASDVKDSKAAAVSAKVATKTANFAMSEDG